MPNNYGSLLQSIATQHIIETLGHQCEIINYVRKDERGLQGILSSMVSKKEWNENSLKKFAYIILRYPGEWMAQRAFDRMRKLHLKLTPACYTQKELKLLKADVFMTGSDQVWGPLFKVKYDPTYFLDFTDSTSKKISYAVFCLKKKNNRAKNLFTYIVDTNLTLKKVVNSNKLAHTQYDNDRIDIQTNT